MGRSARLSAACFGLLAAVGCRAVRPAASEFVERLERCADPADERRLEAAAAALAAGLPRRALAGLEEPARRNPACARIAFLAYRALVLLASRGADERMLAKLKERWNSLYDPTRPGLEGATAAFARALFLPGPEARLPLLERAVRLEPQHYPALAVLGETLWRLGEVRRASATLKRALGLKRDLAEGWLVLARLAHEQGYFKTAAKRFAIYLGLRPFDRRAARDYARLLVHELRDGAAAERVLRPLIAADPDDPDLALNLAAALWLQGKPKAAARVYVRMLEKDPEEARAALNLGNLYYEVLHDDRRALQAYRWLLRMPPSSDPHALLGQLLFVPTRLKRVRARLRDAGVPLPPPPKGPADLAPPAGGEPG